MPPLRRPGTSCRAPAEPRDAPGRRRPEVRPGGAGGCRSPGARSVAVERSAPGARPGGAERRWRGAAVRSSGVSWGAVGRSAPGTSACAGSMPCPTPACLWWSGSHCGAARAAWARPHRCHPRSSRPRAWTWCPDVRPTAATGAAPRRLRAARPTTIPVPIPPKHAGGETIRSPPTRPPHAGPTAPARTAAETAALPDRTPAPERQAAQRAPPPGRTPQAAQHAQPPDRNPQTVRSDRTPHRKTPAAHLDQPRGPNPQTARNDRTPCRKTQTAPHDRSPR